MLEGLAAVPGGFCLFLAFLMVGVYQVYGRAIKILGESRSLNGSLDPDRLCQPPGILK